MKAEIIIDELIVNTIIGIHPHEREYKQPLHISLSFQYNTEKAVKSDSVDDSVDYDQLSQQIKSFVEHHSFQLIETCAEKIADLVLENKTIQKVSLFVYKPHALEDAKRVGIKILREQTKEISPTPHENVLLNWD